MRICIVLCFFLAAQMSFGQDLSETEESGLGNGLRFSLNENQYRFKISGFLQPAYQYAKTENLKAENTLRTKRSYLNFGGRAMKEKVSFFVQADFSAGTPLLDAWAGYDITSKWTVSVGQRRTFTNNREMTFDEDKLQFTDRGWLSTSFTGNGREFGVFLHGSVGKSFVIKPQLAVTSGDGPNSFGSTATDIDLGGFKYGGRLDVYPLGDFTKGNDGFMADLAHESSPKILLGAAGSLNQGASNAKGEGHGNFIFYNASKTQQLPDYRKFSADILLKYKGFSAMAEFTQATASNLNGTYLDSTDRFSQILRPGQISNFLVLGSAWNAEAGYVTKSGYSLNIRYENLAPEFSDEAASVLQKTKVSTVGIGRYFKGQKLKLQAAFSQLEYTGGTKRQHAEMVVQVVF